MPSTSHPQHSFHGPHSLPSYSSEFTSELWFLKEHLPHTPDQRTTSSHPINVLPRSACASLRYRCKRTHLPSETTPRLLRNKVTSGESSPGGPPSLQPETWSLVRPGHQRWDGAVCGKSLGKVGVQGVGKMEEGSRVFPLSECPRRMASRMLGIVERVRHVPRCQLSQLRGASVHRGGQGWCRGSAWGHKASSTWAQAQLHLLTCCPHPSGRAPAEMESVVVTWLCASRGKAKALCCHDNSLPDIPKFSPWAGRGTRRSHGAAVGRWQGNPVPGVPPPSPRCPLPPNSPSLAFLLSTLPGHKRASSQMVPLPGSFSLLSRSVLSYCPTVLFLDAKLAGFLGSPLWSQVSPTAPPEHLSHPPGTAALWPSVGGSLWPPLLQDPHQAPTDPGQDTSSAPIFCS